MKERTNKIIKIILLVAILIISFFFIRKYSLVDIRNIINSYGKNGPIIYIALFSILPIFLFPVPILVLAAGIAFGLKWGTIYTVVASIINAILMYYIGRFIGRDYIENLIKNKLSKKLSNKLLSDNQKTLASVFFVLRLIPLVSYNLINFASGLTKIKLPIYILTTVIGILPGLIIFLNAGDKSLNVKSYGFLIAILLLVFLTVISSFILKWYLKREEND